MLGCIAKLIAFVIYAQLSAIDLLHMVWKPRPRGWCCWYTFAGEEIWIDHRYGHQAGDCVSNLGGHAVWQDAIQTA